MDAWLWTGEEEPPFQGLPPLPKVFREPRLSPLPSLPPPGKAEEEEVQLVDGHGASLQEKITWVHHEMASLRKVDLALFSQLYHLALEIQDLKELQQEMEIFSEEHGFSQNHGAPGEPNSATAFELTI